MVEKNNDYPIIAWADSDFTVSDTQTVEVLDEIVLSKEEKRGGGKKRQPIEKDKSGIKLHEKSLVESIQQLATAVWETIQTRYPLTGILELRTSSVSVSEGLTLLVVFNDIDLETDLRMGFLLSEIESAFRREHNVLCEITYVRKTNHPNTQSVIDDYPHIVKI
jgi:hypothetical protein